ncbi:MAG: c-type cytochrome [Epsilonproteobacteria bacterium]|nr:c-type cytochrome [Campylobacterota bacterium]
MFKLDLKRISTFVALTLFATTSISAQPQEIKLQTPPLDKRAVDGAIKYHIKDDVYADTYKINPDAYEIKQFNFGREATKNEIKARDIDVRYDWQGLPDGKGSVEQGDELYAKHCEMCHGEMGSGGKGYPLLVGGQGTLKNQMLKPGDEPPIKTIGSYWPYASTLWWYVKTGMPFPHPMSLTNDEVYAIVAYLLSLNEITIDGEELDDEYVLTKEKLMKVVMPNVNGFYPDVNGPDGPLVMKKFLSDSSNYATPNVRCMKNCPTAKVVRISQPLDDGIRPPLSTKRDLPKKEEGSAQNSKYAKLFEEKCSACHMNKAIAPVPGDKEEWASRIKQGIETLYEHAIKGFKGMPPKGGAMDLSDEDIKGIVDFMVEQSK